MTTLVFDLMGNDNGPLRANIGVITFEQKGFGYFQGKGVADVYFKDIEGSLPVNVECNYLTDVCVASCMISYEGTTFDLEGCKYFCSDSCIPDEGFINYVFYGNDLVGLGRDVVLMDLSSSFYSSSDDTYFFGKIFDSDNGYELIFAKGEV